MDCLFCNIIAGNLPSEKLYEDEKCIVIKDKYPVAPVHLLVLPKKHIDSVSEMQEEDAPLLGHLIWVAKKVADEQKLAGYKLVCNVNKEGGQVIFHIHIHILAGANLKHLA